MDGRGGAQPRLAFDDGAHAGDALDVLDTSDEASFQDFGHYHSSASLSPPPSPPPPPPRLGSTGRSPRARGVIAMRPPMPPAASGHARRQSPIPLSSARAPSPPSPASAAASAVAPGSYGAAVAAAAMVAAGSPANAGTPLVMPWHHQLGNLHATARSPPPQPPIFAPMPPMPTTHPLGSGSPSSSASSAARVGDASSSRGSPSAPPAVSPPSASSLHAPPRAPVAACQYCFRRHAPSKDADASACPLQAHVERGRKSGHILRQEEISMLLHVYGQTLAEYRQLREGRRESVSAFNPVERAAAYCGVSKNTLQELIQKAVAGQPLEPKLGARGLRGRYPRNTAAQRQRNEDHHVNLVNQQQHINQQQQHVGQQHINQQQQHVGQQHINQQHVGQQHVNQHVGQQQQQQQQHINQHTQHTHAHAHAHQQRHQAPDMLGYQGLPLQMHGFPGQTTVFDSLRNM